MGNITACIRRFKVEEASLPSSSATVASGNAECVSAPAAATVASGNAESVSAPAAATVASGNAESVSAPAAETEPARTEGMQVRGKCNRVMEKGECSASREGMQERGKYKTVEQQGIMESGECSACKEGMQERGKCKSGKCKSVEQQSMMESGECSARREGMQERGKCKSVEQQSVMESGECTSVEQQIEHSKLHWSEVGDYCDSDEEEVAEVSNVEVFKVLQMHPLSQWGNFFFTFGYDLGILPSYGADVKGKREWVLKVFKKGTPLRQLQAQWPHGMLQQYVEKMEHISTTTEPYLRPISYVLSGVLLEDGKFAFLMPKFEEGLRTLIDRNMMMRNAQDCGPFSEDVAKTIIYNVALGVESLHSHNVVHRDIKASNVLTTKYSKGKEFGYLIADYESSIGVIGTGFFRAPEILQACKDRTIHQKPELFTKESDIYSFGMCCYEILTGKLPFKDYSLTNYDLVLNGRCPELPEYVDGWACELLSRCWHPNPACRPSIGDILNLITSNSIGTLVEYRKRLKVLMLSCR
jgi:serine/threonine protein kinase